MGWLRDVRALLSDILAKHLELLTAEIERKTSRDHLDRFAPDPELRDALAVLLAMGIHVEGVKSLARQYATGRPILLAGEDPGRPPVPGLQYLPLAHAATVGVLRDVAAERVRQVRLHGDQVHLPDGTGGQSRANRAAAARGLVELASQHGLVTFTAILSEEFHEALAETDPTRLRDELVQLAAVAVQWAEAIDRRPAGHDPGPGP